MVDGARESSLCAQILIIYTYLGEILEWCQAVDHRTFNVTCLLFFCKVACLHVPRHAG